MGKVSASSLECFTCVALAGICAEYVEYGSSEGGAGDIQQLDVMLKSLQFSQKKADSEVRCVMAQLMGFKEGLMCSQNLVYSAKVSKYKSLQACLPHKWPANQVCGSARRLFIFKLYMLDSWANIEQIYTLNDRVRHS